MRSPTSKNRRTCRWWCLLPVLWIVAGTALAGGAVDTGPPVITPGEAHRMMDERDDTLFVNTMSAIECRDHRIPGSLCIACPEFEKTAPALIENRDRPIIVYCASTGCHRSIHAADKARGLGYRNVFILDGGLPAWKEAGYAVESERRIPRKGIASIKPKVLSRLIDEKQNILVLDIRTGDLFEREHVPGAVNIPFDELEDACRELPMNRKIVVVDEEGHRSFLAACYLYERGLVDIQRLFGGMKDWRSFMKRRK
ncbi:MAG: rhodanese-like domain-containing protein [Deltaproteobacteria bacterium]|nr:rhodanese-like domain-containing protein [Deltaproteobacteria bacterium]